MDAEFVCRSCGHLPGEPVLNLGSQPLANRLLSAEEIDAPEPRFPLELFVCPKCWLLQIGHTVPPSDLFTDYLYFSSYSQSMLDHARSAAVRYVEEYQLGENSLVVEIASNDGYLLNNFQQSGVPCLGIEPASNIAKVSVAQGIETWESFFSEETATELLERKGPADLILGNNVFAHAPDTNDFTAGLARALKPEGTVILEFPYAVDLIEKNEFDTIYHEHIFYFTLTSLLPLFHRHGLEIEHVEHLSIHGGSLRLFAKHRDAAEAVRNSVTKQLATESALGVDSESFYHGFAERVAGVKTKLTELITSLRAEGKSVAAYGASAKGSTLLNYCDFSSSQLDFIVDRSEHKQGLFSPGVHLPILCPEELARRRPDYTLLLTWNFADEIIEQQKSYLENGGRFIVPIPEPRIL